MLGVIRMVEDQNKARLPFMLTVLGDLLPRLEAGRSVVFDEIARAVGAAAEGKDFGTRHRHFLRTAANHISTYLHLFAPTGCEHTIDDEVLVWELPQGRVADVLVFSRPDAAVIERDARTAARRLLADGFVAVRFCKLTAPLRSLALTDRNAPPVELYGSEFWFGHASHSADQIRAVVGGGL